MTTEPTHDPRNPRRKNTPEQDEEFLRQRFDQTLPERVRRRQVAPVHAAIPAEWFAPATRECRDLFVDGHFYGAICLTQAVAEGISKFLIIRNGHRDTGNQNSRISLLLKRGVISREAYRAFKRIEGGDRNDYHHLNATIETDFAKLDARAEMSKGVVRDPDRGVRVQRRRRWDNDGGESSLLAEGGRKVHLNEHRLHLIGARACADSGTSWAHLRLVTSRKLLNRQTYAHSAPRLRIPYALPTFS